MSVQDATRSHARNVSSAAALAVALWLAAIPVSPCHAQQDARVKPASASVPEATCKAPAATATAPGFSLFCGKRIPAGIFLGSFLSPAADGIGDCIKRCAADAACAAFSLDNRDLPADRVCTLFGSVEGFADEQAGVAGVKAGRAPKVKTAAQASRNGSDFPDAKKPKTPVIVFQPSDTTGPIWNDDSGYINNSVGSGAGGKFFHWGKASGLTKTLSEWTDKTVFWAGSKEATGSPKPAEDTNGGDGEVVLTPFHWGKAGSDTTKTISEWNDNKPAEDVNGQVVLTPDMLKLQPVYFATDRVRAAGAPLEASFTAGRNPDMSYGYAMVSIPKNHRIGNVDRPKFRYLKWSYEAETDADHFRIKALTSLDRDGFVSQLKDGADSVLLFIHGYNVSFSDAVFKAAQIACDANFAGTVLVFSWPSAGELVKYDQDRDSAEFAVPHLTQIFRLLSEEIGKKNVYIVAHSMGNQTLVTALQQAALSKANLTISELVMAAPDVDKDVFRSKVDQIRAVAKNITLYASSADKALLASGEKSFGTRLGFVGPTGPNIFPGIIDVIDVSAVGDDMLGLDHSTYSSRAVLDDLGHLIRSLTHLAPDIRTPTLRLMPDRAHTQYWLYPP